MDWIYEINSDNTSRFVLGTKGEKTLICFGINPSTAEPGILDNTMKSVDRISKANGYDSWVMLNIYPQRATNPNEMCKERDSDSIQDNLLHIERILRNGNVDIWAAWGTLISKRPHLFDCLHEGVEIYKKYSCRWYRAGKLSKDGHPHHPLYLKSTEKLLIFDINAYAGNKSSVSLYDEITGIKASVGGYFGGYIDAEIDLKHSKVNWQHHGNGDTKTLSRFFKECEGERFIEGLKSTTLLDWEEAYVEPGICDGTQWKVDIMLGEVIKEKRGDNKFPKEWKRFCTLISEITGKEFI
jgi:hypothetical protein